MQSLLLKPLNRVRGEVTLPGSKSLSNRLLLLAAMSAGETRIINLLDSDDVRHMLAALTRLQVGYTLNDDRTECRVQGLAGLFCVTDPCELFLGNAGTAVRPLTAALCLSQGEFTVTGEPRMYERPIGPLVDGLEQLVDLLYPELP